MLMMSTVIGLSMGLMVKCVSMGKLVIFYSHVSLPLRKPIACQSTVRLQHLNTMRYLHSHEFSSPLSGNQEVSAFGDGSGSGDRGKSWQTLI